MKKVLLLSLLLAFGFISKAQGYNQAVGARLGWSAGFEYRIYTDDTNSYKFLLSTRDRGAQLHLFREFHEYDLFSFSSQLVLFYGGGVHAGYERWNEVHYNYNTRWTDTRTAATAGINGLIGVEYVLYEYPVSFGVEAKPYFQFLGREAFDIELFDFGFTIKYLF